MRAFSLALCLALLSPAMAWAIDALPFKDRAEELRFQHLTRQLRGQQLRQAHAAGVGQDAEPRLGQPEPGVVGAECAFAGEETGRSVGDGFSG